MKIGELAKLTGCPVETIRYYEREGLLPSPSRTAGNYRDYHEEHVECLSFIRHCRALDMTQDEIRLLLRLRGDSQADCAEVNHLLDEHLQHVRDRISSLQVLQAQLELLRQRCSGAGDVGSCGILRELQSVSQDEVRMLEPHVPGVHGR